MSIKSNGKSQLEVSEMVVGKKPKGKSIELGQKGANLKALLSLLAALFALILTRQAVFAAEWSITTAPIADWNGIACSANGSNLVAVCFPYIFNLGGIYVSTNRGATWAKTDAPDDPITNRWEAVASSADGVKLVAVTEGGSGAIYTSTNSGLSWNQTSAPNTSYSCVASSPDGTKLVAADYYGQGVYTSTDSGETWATTLLWEFNNSVAISADGHTILASSYLLGLPGQANSGVLDYSINSGESFKQGDAPTNVNWAGVACSTNGELMVAAGQSSTNSSDPGAIYVSTDSGMNWLPTTAPALPWFCIACSADGSKITAGALGDGITIPSAVYSSTNYGVTWEENDAIQNNTNTFGASAIASSADGSKLVAADGYILIYPPLNEYGTRPPNLTITFVAPHSVVVSWPATGSSTLQQNSSLANASWVTNTNPITTMNGTNSITITPPNGHLFFRLSEP